MATDFKTILNLTVPMIVKIGERKLPVNDVLALAPGSIIELPKTADEELAFSINNKTIGHGTAVKVGENFGIRISEISSARSRAETLLRS